MAARNVTVISASFNLHTKKALDNRTKRKVAGYARVSTDSDEQFTSYTAQVDYYTNYIMQKPEWEFVNVYTDEGISGTNTKKRDGFNAMIADALCGKIDLIVTKSVSRFARNTVDSLSTIRRLKEKGVEVFFEKENIWTFDSKGELLITIMSSLAQEESRSISENVTWGKRKQFADGNISLAYSTFLGYDKGPNGTLVINEREAPIVRMIYREFMQGNTPFGIARELTQKGIPTPGGKDTWMPGTVTSILQNEKYKGSALLQKKYTVDFLTKTMRTNTGEVPQYYIENSHEAIIPPTEWEQVQRELSRRREYSKQYRGNNILAAKLVCGDCGAFYGSKVWNSTDPKYRRTIWQCNNKYKGKKRCTTPHIQENEIKEKFIIAFNEVYAMRDELIENCEIARSFFADCTALDDERDKLLQEIEEITDLSAMYINNNATNAQNQAEYQKKYDALVSRYENARCKLERIEQEKAAKLQKADSFAEYIDLLKSTTEKAEVFDATIWVLALEKAIVHPDKTITFVFRDNTEYTI